MVKDTANPVPEPTIRRLPTYVHYLKGLLATIDDSISTSHMSKDLGLDPTQIRKDLSYLDVTGKNRVGYKVLELIDAMEEFLGWNNFSDAFLIGAGHLGAALMGYERLDEYGIKIVAAFDVDPARVGSVIHGVEVFHVSKLADLIKKMHINIGIITVPAERAQNVVDIMSEAGIKAIWNFAPIWLKTEREDLIIVNDQLYASLSIMTRKLKNLLVKE